MDKRPLRTTRRPANYASGRPGWYRITNAERVLGEPDRTRVDIYDEIGFMAVGADQFNRDLAGIDGDIELHINSPGGDVFDGIAIYNNLRQRQGVVSVVVDGLAASAASFIAQAASPGHLAMAPHSQLMIHEGFGMGIGNAADMRQLADLLDKTSDNIARIYADRTGKPAEYWRGKMRAETWLDDHEAVAEGLADHVLGQETPQNSWDLSVFLNARNAAGEAPEAEGNHEPMTGTHSHGHPNGHGYAHSHEHTHNGDAEHSGDGHYDPDHDGDNDATAAGDTDHDYVLPDGSPGPKATGVHRFFNEKYSAEDRRTMAGNGQAMPDGSYPIGDEEDLHKAIHAVGRGGSEHDAIRRHIIKRAKALGHADAIPENWNGDGSLNTSAGNLSDEQILALFVRELDQLSAGKE